eukprot:m.47219 g.47219  ORF g.47219 m.47219 type:complete len:92 (-) comp11910_c0_seq1:92-367(-)
MAPSTCAVARFCLGLTQWTGAYESTKGRWMEVVENIARAVHHCKNPRVCAQSETAHCDCPTCSGARVQQVPTAIIVCCLCLFVCFSFHFYF